MAQYTIRNVPQGLDRELRENAQKRGVSLNQAAIDALRHGLGLSADAPSYHDPAFDAAVRDQDTVDPDLWP